MLTDELFVDCLNVFLALPTFGARIFYNKLARTFEEHRLIVKSARLATVFDSDLSYVEKGVTGDTDSFIKVLNPSNCLDYLTEKRIPFFAKSVIYFQYELGGRIAKRLRLKKAFEKRGDLLEFLHHIEHSKGHHIYLCLLDVLRASRSVMNMRFDTYFIAYLRRIYFTDNSPTSLCGVVKLSSDSEVMIEGLVEQLCQYWLDRHKVHLEYLDVRPAFLTETEDKMAGWEALQHNTLLVRAPLEWRRYKLPNTDRDTHTVDLSKEGKRDLVLRALSLEKLSGGFVWEHIKARGCTLGVQRCLVLIYYVQLWLEASTPSLVERIKPPHKIADYIYCSMVHVAGERWVGCPQHVRQSVARLIGTGNLNCFKPAVDFAISYLCKPLIEVYRDELQMFDTIRIDGRMELRNKLTREAKKENIFMAIGTKDIYEEGAETTLTTKDCMERNILHILDRDDILNEIFCRRFSIETIDIESIETKVEFETLPPSKPKIAFAV